MSGKNAHILLKVEQQGDTSLYRMRAKERFFVGQHPGCDVVVYGQKMPRKHPLITGKGRTFRLRLTEGMRGHVMAGDSRLAFSDLMAHGLLARKGRSFVYPISPGKQGVLTFEDVKITFQCLKGVPEASRNELADFKGFSWAFVTLKHWSGDLSFKFILLVLVIANFFFIRYLNGIPIDVSRTTVSPKVPDRLVRIIVRKQPAETSRRNVAAAAQESEGKEGESNRPKEQERGRKNVRPENQGLLGLLTGVGNSKESGSLADFLLDKGLVKELDEVLASSDLKVGKGATAGETDDVLLATSDTGQGIEDILQDVGEVQNFSLGQRGELKFDKISEMTGTDEALGRRSEESVQTVIQRNKGRLLYIYKKYLKHDAGFAGKLVVEIVIEANGSVSGVHVVDSSMKNADFQREVIDFIRRWRFPAIEHGKVTVNFPLFFNRIG